MKKQNIHFLYKSIPASTFKMLISRVIFVTLPLLLVPIVYGSVSSSPSEYEACAARPDPNRGSNCSVILHDGVFKEVCCWIDEEGHYVCQTCLLGSDTGKPTSCDEPIDWGGPKESSGVDQADPGSGQTPPTQTFPGGDVFSPPTGGVADPDPGTDDNPTKPKTLGGSKDNIGTAKPPRELEQGSFDPPEPPDDDSGKENDDQRGQDLKAKGPDESDLPSGGDGGSGVVG